MKKLISLKHATSGSMKKLVLLNRGSAKSGNMKKLVSLKHAQEAQPFHYSTSGSMKKLVALNHAQEALPSIIPHRAV